MVDLSLYTAWFPHNYKVITFSIPLLPIAFVIQRGYLRELISTMIAEHGD